MATCNPWLQRATLYFFDPKLTGHFPPRAMRSKFNKNLNGPILENCFYSLLLHLKNLEELVIPAAPLVIARLSILLTPVQRDEVKLKLKQLVFGWDERLEANINILIICFLLVIKIL